MSDKEIPMLSPEFKEAWEKASCLGNSKFFEDRAKLLADISRENAFALLFERELTAKEIQNNGLFCSVTEKVNSTKKPGRFVRPSDFEKIQLNGGGIEDLNTVENINPGLIGITVDYLTRLMTGDIAEKAFHISLMGADKINAGAVAEALLKTVKELDDNSICAAVRLTGFDSIYRAGENSYIPIYPYALTCIGVKKSVLSIPRYMIITFCKIKRRTPRCYHSMPFNSRHAPFWLFC